MLLRSSSPFSEKACVYWLRPKMRRYADTGVSVFSVLAAKPLLLLTAVDVFRLAGVEVEG
jgi:hypothetical protein